MEQNKDSLDVIREAMGNVIQEMIIILDGEHHLVYIQKLKISKKGKVEFEFSTADESKKEALIPHIENCIKIQIEEFIKENKTWKLSSLFSRT